jgi:nicotinate-nucleotide adenylyltransferase
MIGLLGGTFNPPHNGHVALARAAEEELGLDDLVVLVAERPGHKRVGLDAADRLRLTRAAFPDRRVELDEHERTVDLLRERRFDDAVFLIGADEFCDFLDWKDPNGVLELVPVAVGARPGYPRERLVRVLERLDRPDRVSFFELDPVPIASREVRERAAKGEPIEDLVPPAVAEEIARLGLYRR